jgi:hypothetical protein
MSMTLLRCVVPASLIAVEVLTCCSAAHAKLPRLKVSDNGHFLVTEDGGPFFWLGDTAWRLFYNLTREETETYLKDRAAKGFNVIQAVALSWTLDPNAYGERPLFDNDPLKPNEKFWRHVDWAVRRTEELGMYVGFLPTWGDHVVHSKIINRSNAREYGRWLGERYRNAALVWILGGDQPAEGFVDVWRELAIGLREGDGGAHLITYHPRGWQTSSQWLHNEPWLDLNMVQSSHTRDAPTWRFFEHDWALEPPKPVVEGEPNYEHIANGLKAENVERGDLITAWDCRKKAYWNVFAGACGFTYGCNEVYQFWKPGRPVARWGSSMVWWEAIKLPGSAQMRHLKRLMLSRPFLVRIPDQSLIAEGQADGAGHVQATRAADGSYAMVYIGDGHPVMINLAELSGEMLEAWWYSPRDGKIYGEDGKPTGKPFAHFGRTDKRRFSPPTQGPGNDWVLVIDDASRNFPSPGHSGK